jgi:hypothetical protein
VAHETLIHRLDAQAITPSTHTWPPTVDEAQFRRRGPLGSLGTLTPAPTGAVKLGEVTGPTRDGRSHQDRQPGFRLATPTACRSEKPTLAESLTS